MIKTCTKCNAVYRVNHEITCIKCGGLLLASDPDAAIRSANQPETRIDNNVISLVVTVDNMSFSGLLSIGKWKQEYKVGTYRNINDKSIFHGFEINGYAEDNKAYLLLTYFSPEHKYGTVISGEGESSWLVLPLENRGILEGRLEIGWGIRAEITNDKMVDVNPKLAGEN